MPPKANYHRDFGLQNQMANGRKPMPKEKELAKLNTYMEHLLRAQ